MAWLNATPKPPAGSRRAKSQDAAPAISRIAQLKKSGVTPQMPPNPATHIVDRLVEIGLTEATGMGAVPIRWQTINAWSAATSVRLSPWEARLLRRLSVEYLAEGQRAESENCPPPWRAEVTASEREMDERRLRALLG